MNFVAIKMLVGDRAKYLGIILGLTFATLLITQQLSIFIGLMSRTYALVTNITEPDIWVMDPEVKNVDDIRPMADGDLYRVRGVTGVQWAVPLFKGQIRAKLPNGQYQVTTLLGLDDQSLVGGPPELLGGAKMNDLRQADAVFVDAPNADEKLGGLGVGDVVELNDHRAKVVGRVGIVQSFVTTPVMYTTYSRARSWSPPERSQLSFVLVKAGAGEDVGALTERIRAQTGLAAYSSQELKDRTLGYYLRNTGIPINFGTTVTLGFIVGVAVAGMMFYQFANDNIRYFGTLKAMGASNWMLVRMVLLQAVMAGAIGYGMGVGLTVAFKWVMSKLTPESQQVMIIIWQPMAIGAGAIFFIVMAASLLAMVKVVRLEPGIVFK